jgi:predicted lipoprotein with Yx(FWY)xxD motif
MAAADAAPQGAWSLIPRDGGARQWVLDGKPVYRYADEGGPGTSFGDGDGGAWHLAMSPIWTPPGVSIGKAIAGTVLADAKGLTLYTRTQDAPNKPNCAGSCLEGFVPVAAAGLALGSGDWSVVTRADSSKQWAYKGKPLYRSLLDVKIGDANGDGTGVDEGWHAALLVPAPPVPSWVTVQQSLGGEVFADPHGFTLYFHGGPRRSLSAGGGGAAAGRKACETSTCMGAEWKAVLADGNAKPVGNWTIVDNTDSTRQWAYKGVRLWTNTIETKPAELKGLRFGGDRSWKAMSRGLQPVQNM